MAIGGGVLVVLVAIGSFVTWQRNKDSAVSGLLADAMVIYEAPVQAPVPGDAGSTAAPTQMPGTRSPGGNEPSWRSVSPVRA